MSAPHERSSTPPGLTPEAFNTTIKATLSVEDGLDLAYWSSSEEESPGRDAGQALKIAKEGVGIDRLKRTEGKRSKDDAVLQDSRGDSEVRRLKAGKGPVQAEDPRACGPAPADPGPSSWVDHPRSYQEAVLRPRTFRPRFPPVSSNQQREPWLHEDSWKVQRRGVPSVWGRLGERDTVPSMFHRPGAGHTNHRARAEERRRMDPMLMEFPPGDVGMRPHVVFAAAARTQEIRDEERALELSTLVAVQRDAQVPLTCAMVLRDAPHQLGVPEHELSVEGLSRAKFLLRFGSPVRRNAALAVQAFQVGNCILNIMPWSNRIGAKVGKLKFRARVCLEGVPRHARNAAAVAQLFSNPSFIDEVDCPVEKEAERFCFNLWVWTDAPSDLALQGTLQLEAPIEHSEQYFLSMGNNEIPPIRARPAKTSDYEVLIHLDRVLDYTPPSTISRRDSFESDSSDDLPAAEYPAVFPYDWHLGLHDGDRPVRRMSVHDRLGRTTDRRDRSPPRGGNGGGGLGLRQWPPASVHAVARMPVRGGNRGAGAGSSGGHGGGRRRDGGVTAGDQMVWRVRQGGGVQGSTAVVGREQGKEDEGPAWIRAEDSFRSDDSWVQDTCREDPMLAEATGFSDHGQGKPMLPQCSVEPPMANGLLPVSDYLVGERVAATQAESVVQMDTVQNLVKGLSLQEDLVELAADPAKAYVSGSTEHAVASSASASAIAAHAAESVSELMDAPDKVVASTDGSWAQQTFELGQVCEGTADGPALLAIGPIPGAVEPIYVDGPLPGTLRADGLTATGFQTGDPLPFDLNVRCEELEGNLNLINAKHVAEGQHSATVDVRQVLGKAEGRLNKGAGGHKPPPRGLSRFAIPLSKSLLCNPPVRQRNPAPKKPGSSEVANPAKRSAQGVKFAGTDDEQATVFLMKACGIPNVSGTVDGQAQKLLGEQFVIPMQEEAVGDVREAFGLPKVGEIDVLSPLIAEAEPGNHD
ncbi:unnamed protein product [Urochloa decumbens]|uniref:Uncharacterized protein n=1 Tax=Urochloa decumbens TaxID=240449 RepID=A0ABC9GXA7_9POAL